ncbi:TonB-dependent receptor [Desertivirga arenae]|uniref:TonB-dependent receptor n=1 Tax=Desertivirga arenae TaxID=2810309 RepID=UPI001A96AEF0|nr:TonB-dependent receptor [Pedobacter sp. SYSU D00823]
MRTCLALFAFLSICLCTKAQFVISGNITTSTGKPAEFATVLLSKRSDSTLVKSALTTALGRYTFNNIAPGSYLIRTSLLGFKRAERGIEISTKNVDVPEIRLVAAAASQLKEVTVTAKKPFLEQRPDKLVVNVDASATSAGSTAFEVLQKVPGLIITNDKLTIVGRGTPNILIDGRSSQYTDINQVLKDLSAANIDRIEVITNPGAKYDAAGGAVINIILKRNANLGTNGSIALSSGIGLYERGTYNIDRNFYRASPSITLNHREGKVNVFGNYSFFHRNLYEYSEFDRIISPNRYVQLNYTPTAFSSHNFRIGTDLYADKKNTFGIILRGFTRDGDRMATNATEQLLSSDNSHISNFQTEIATDNKRGNFSGNVNWKHSFDTIGTDLNIDLDYSHFNSSNNSIISNILSNGSQYENEQRVRNPVNLGVLKIDYVKTFTKDSKLEAGAKSSLASIDNYLTYSSNGIFDENRSTDFKYNENINAIYSSYQQKFGNWNLQAGLRAEQTIAKGKDEGGTVLDRNYIQLFPSVFVTRNINSKIASVLQYSRRVNRPSFNQQNPFIEYLDSLTYTQGNPKLRPETADQYKLSITYDNQPFFSVSYNKKQDVIFDNAPKQNGNLTYTTSENLASFNNLAFELNFPLKLGKKISGFGGNQFIYNHYKADYLGSKFDRGKWNWLAYWQTAYKPTKTISFEISGYYMTKFLNEFILIKNLGSLNASVQKTFWDNKARLSLNVQDVLFSDKVRGSILYQEINVNFRQFYESRNARLTFSYSFGNQKLKAERNRKTASEDESSRVKKD